MKQKGIFISDKNSSRNLGAAMGVHAFLTIAIGSSNVGTIDILLYEETVPRTVKNFIHHLKHNFKGTSFHRVIKGFMAQGGDYINGDGTGGESVYGKSFDDESFQHRHSDRGILSMANSGPNTNASQFFITFKETPHLDGKHVVFGRVIAGEEVLRMIENVQTGSNNLPKLPITIVDCGIQSQESSELVKNEFECNQNNTQDFLIEPSIISGIASEEIEDKDPLKKRLRLLKMKMNQARQLNRQEVQKEGERLGSDEGKARERDRIAKELKRQQAIDDQARNDNANILASQVGYENGKFLLEPAAKSMSRVQKREATLERNRFHVKDYYNPEGQFRHYERSIKSIPKNIDRSETDTFDPIMTATVGSSKAGSDDGPKRLADELKRRIEKQKESNRKRMEFEAEDVTYINKRNKHYNKKISRNYDTATAEIRQNLERGTAL
jgi:cyclophilin family peptidyl-prolyl cis-trans isomerase